MKLSLVTIAESVEKIDLGELLGAAMDIVEDDPETAAKMLKFYDMARSKGEPEPQNANAHPGNPKGERGDYVSNKLRGFLRGNI